MTDQKTDVILEDLTWPWLRTLNRQHVCGVCFACVPGDKRAKNGHVIWHNSLLLASESANV